jgi:hypothetical protein
MWRHLRIERGGRHFCGVGELAWCWNSGVRQTAPGRLSPSTFLMQRYSFAWVSFFLPHSMVSGDGKLWPCNLDVRVDTRENQVEKHQPVDLLFY